MALLDKIKNKKIKIGISVFILIGLIGGGYYLTRLNLLEKDTEVTVNNTLETYTIADNEKVFINGVILPLKSKNFAPSTQGEISKLNVTNGKIVKEGDFLFTTKNQSILDEIENLNSQLTSIKSSSLENDPSTKTEILKLQSQISSLNKKAYINTNAPFAGKIYLDEQQENTEQQGIAMTLESNEFYMKGQVSEQDLPKLQVDDPVNVLVLSTNTKVAGRISYISDRPSSSSEGVNTNSQSQLSYYDISVSFDNQENLVNGFHVQASVEIKDSICKVPSSAILRDKNEKPYVFETLNGILKKQTVQIQSQNDEYTVVKGGLDKKDIILRYPTPEMKEGDDISTTNSTGKEASDKKDGK
ncbi:efflux RND transporter periplasmic adaptor subunit [Romboutsia sp.]|uniref:efflux RND transporter periplasmic adaptor subunit n=1 Tax=Romboutsia sp. TaxID=1965302 RepID=UPI003F33EBDF